jgi:hypothetical protein
MRHGLFGSVCLAAIVLVASGCSAEKTPAQGGGAAAGDDDGSAGSLSISVGSGSGGSGGVAEVFGHSASSLYRMDPITKAVAAVGPFSGCGEVVDIAVDADSNLFGTSEDALYRIDPATAACTLVASGAYPNSLSFVPKGTVDPDVEALVGYVGATYVRIEPSTGELHEIGELSGGYESSGDIVSVQGGKTLLTVTGADCEDCIVEVDPATGDLVKSYGPLGYGEVFGLAFWAGSAFGFSSAGDLFEVAFDGDVVSTSPIAIPSAPADLSFWGAGSTTSAPPEAVPK